MWGTLVLLEFRLDKWAKYTQIYINKKYLWREKGLTINGMIIEHSVTCLEN